MTNFFYSTTNYLIHAIWDYIEKQIKDFSTMQGRKSKNQGGGKEIKCRAAISAHFRSTYEMKFVHTYSHSHTRMQ